MKLSIFCLLMLAVVSNASWSGQWYIAGTTPNTCSPAGLLVITDANSKLTVKGKWNPASPNCKDLGLTGDFEGTLAGSLMSFNAQAKSGPVVVAITFTAATAAEPEHIQTVITAATPVSAKQGLVKIIDDKLTKIKDYKGKYTFKLTKGDATKCCIPDSIEVTEPETNIFVAKGKFPDSAACKAKHVENLDWDKATTSILTDYAMWKLPLATGENIGKISKNADQKYIFESNAFTAAECEAQVSKGGSNWWIWIIVVIIIAVVLVVGFCLYRRNQSNKLQHSLLTAP